MVSYNSNNIFFSPIKFEKSKNSIVFKCPYRQNFARTVTFDVSIMSSNYPNMDIDTSFDLSVVGRI